MGKILSIIYRSLASSLIFWCENDSNEMPYLEERVNYCEEELSLTNTLFFNEYW